MRTIIPALLLGSLVFVAILYLNAFQPQIFRDMLAKTGLSAPVETGQPDASKIENTRRQKINALIISDTNKRDLLEGRPYWGAAAHMIPLAMHQPPDGGMARTEGDIFYEFQNYFFTDQRGLLTFEFQNNQLACVHYLRELRTQCNTGKTSLYATSGFPYAETAATFQNK